MRRRVGTEEELGISRHHGTQQSVSVSCGLGDGLAEVEWIADDVVECEETDGEPGLCNEKISCFEPFKSALHCIHGKLLSYSYGAGHGVATGCDCFKGSTCSAMF